MKSLKNKIKARIILWLFSRYFKGYAHPFKKMGDRFSGMTELEQMEYLGDINRFVKSKAFEYDIEDEISNFMEKISFSAVGEMELTAYRVTLIYIRDKEQRLKNLAQLYQSKLDTNHT